MCGRNRKSRHACWQDPQRSPLPPLLPPYRGSNCFNTGRWMKEEHEDFLRSVDQYDKNWDFIATIVTTRSVLQIRTHGQKYFAKLERGGLFPEQVRSPNTSVLPGHSSRM